MAARGRARRCCCSNGWTPWSACRASPVALALPLLAPTTCGAHGADEFAVPRARPARVTSYRDGDYSFGLSLGAASDELGELVAAHNALGEALREQRLGLVQRELLLDTMVQNTPVAMLLVEPDGRIVFANLAARKLLGEGRQARRPCVSKTCWRARRPAARRASSAAATACSRSATTTSEETLPPGAPRFPPQRPAPRIAAAAPAHHRAAPAGSADLEEGDPRDQPRIEQFAGAGRIAGAFGRGTGAPRPDRTAARPSATIEERARHLEGFIRGYARFAKLPAPRLEPVHWPRFIAQPAHARSISRSKAAEPDGHARFDAAQTRTGAAEPAQERARIRHGGRRT